MFVQLTDNVWVQLCHIVSIERTTERTSNVILSNKSQVTVDNERITRLFDAIRDGACT
jgi:hypothetical protein